MPSTLTKVKTAIGYAAHFRMLRELSDEPIGEIPRTIAQPYRYSPTHSVYDRAGVPVIVCETAHRRFVMYRVDALETIQPVSE